MRVWVEDIWSSSIDLMHVHGRRIRSGRIRPVWLSREAWKHRIAQEKRDYQTAVGRSLEKLRNEEAHKVNEQGRILFDTMRNLDPMDVVGRDLIMEELLVLPPSASLAAAIPGTPIELNLIFRHPCQPRQRIAGTPDVDVHDHNEYFGIFDNEWWSKRRRGCDDAVGYNLSPAQAKHLIWPTKHIKTNGV